MAQYLIKYVLFLFLLGFSLQTSQLYLHIAPKEKECIYEFFADKTLVIFDIQSNSTTTRVYVQDSEQKVMWNAHSLLEYHYSFTTFSGGYSAVCMLNTGDRHAQFNFNLKHGVAAKDFSSVAKYKDLKPLELDVKYY
jgi:hypothetical protein